MSNDGNISCPPGAQKASLTRLTLFFTHGTLVKSPGFDQKLGSMGL